MRVQITNQPFSGTGAKLYAGIGSAAAIQYRPQKTYDSRKPTINATFVNDVSVASVTSPTASFSLTVPAAWHNQTVYLQTRVFSGGWENETFWRPRAVQIDGSGNLVQFVAGTYRRLGVDLVDGGGVTVRYSWLQNRDSLKVGYFSIAWVSGPTHFATVSVGIYQQRVQRIGLAGLAAGNYTATLTAYSGTTGLLVDTISFTIPAAPATTATLTISEDF
jgi:hypothetical protein